MRKWASMITKTVVLTFDDGRKDQFDNAVKIMKEYNLTGTVFVTTSFVDKTHPFKTFLSADNQAMSIENCIYCKENGIEIASHGDMHKNTAQDIKNSLKKLKAWGVYEENDPVGFASPGSEISEKRLNDIEPLLETGELSYLRTGTRLKDKSPFYIFMYIANNIMKSKYLFYALNKNNINNKDDLKKAKNFMIRSVAVKNNTPVTGIKHLINQSKENDIVVLMFHSILDKSDVGYGKDSWFYDIKYFIELCKWLSENKFNVITLKEALNLTDNR